MNFAFCSFGNDSIALIQWLHNRNTKNVVVVHSDTQWSASGWPARVDAAAHWIHKIGYELYVLKTEGMESLVRRKNAFPRGGSGRFKFCTAELKIIPALALMDELDPDRKATCWIGVRREESRHRAKFPYRTQCSESHGGRELIAPLVRYKEARRNDLILQTPFSVLPHKSRECWPCVNTNMRGLRSLDEEAIKKVEKLEQEMGTNSKGSPIVMFSPNAHNGAIGIRAVIENANRSKTAYLKEDNICTAGWCGL